MKKTTIKNDELDSLLVDRKELARLLNVSADTVKRWTQSRIISVIKVKHVYRYHPETVLKDLKLTAEISAKKGGGK